MAKKNKQPAIIEEQAKMLAYSSEDLPNFWFYDPDQKTYIRGPRMGALLTWEELGPAETTNMDEAIRLHNNQRSNTMGFDNEGAVFTPDFTDVHDEITLPDGTEAHLQIKYVNSDVDKNGAPYFQFSYEVIDEPYAKLVRHFLGLPGPNDDARKRNGKMLRLREWMKAHGMDQNSPLIANDMIGLECWAILKLKEDDEYGEQNEVKKFLNLK